MSREPGNSWQQLKSHRYPRRTMLRGATLAGVGGAALALVGCGDDDDDQDGTGRTPTQPGQISEPTPTPTNVPEDQPEYGGTLRTGTFLDVLGIDPHIEVSVGLTTAGRVYTYLGAFNTRDNEFHPLLAESYEQPSDTEYVFTLNQGFKYQNLPQSTAEK